MKPTAIKKLEGNPGKRPLNEHEPEYDISSVSAPDWLDDGARKEWDRLAPQLMRNKLLTDAEVAIFSTYCQAYADVGRLTKDISTEGETAPDRSGGVKRNPKVMLKYQAIDVMLKCIQQLGFSPVARMKISTEAQGEKKNPFLKYSG